MRLDLVLVGILVTTLFFTGGIVMINEFKKTYNETGVNFTVDEFESTFQYINDVTGIESEIRGDVLDTEISNTDEAWNSMTKGSYTGISFFAKNSIGIITNVTSSAANILKIPKFIVNIGLSVFTVLVVFTIISTVFRFRS